MAPLHRVVEAHAAIRRNAGSDHASLGSAVPPCAMGTGLVPCTTRAA